MTFTQQGISVTSTKVSGKHAFYVEVKIPSTVAKQPRTCVVENKDLHLEIVRKHPCFNDVVIYFCQEYIVDKNGEFLCDKPICLSYEDEFYRYKITLQPSFYAPPPSLKSQRCEKSQTSYRNSRTPSGLTSWAPIPYTHTNVARPYSGGRATPK